MSLETLPPDRVLRFGAIGPALHQAGWEIIPIKEKTKRPVIKNWQQGFTGEQIEQFARNGYAGGSVGLLAKHFPGVDIDVSDQACADALEAAAIDAFGQAPIRYGSAPKRLLMYRTDQPFTKVKVFLQAPDGSRQGPDGKDYAVEFLGDGQQYLVYGEHPDGFEYRWPAHNGPADTDVWDLSELTLDAVTGFIERIAEYLPDGWSVADQTTGSVSASTEVDLFENYRPPVEGWDLQRVVDEILPHLDPDADRAKWLKVGMALHHQGQGDEDWLDAWDAWSQASSKYVEGDCATRWKSFNKQRATGNGAVTLGSLVKQTKDARDQAQRSQRDALMVGTLQAIAAVSDARDLQDQVAARIANTPAFTDIEREQLAAEIQKRAKDLGLKLPIATVRGWVRSRTARSSPNMPEWARPWVYVTEGDKFFNTDTKQEVTPQGFRALYNRLMPLTPDGNRERADQYALEQWGLPVVSHKAYMPTAGVTFEMFGLQWVNLYRPESVPAMPGVCSNEELEALAIVQDHFDRYLPDEREQKLLISWLAHNVQQPGKKVRWAPYIHGVPGDGKSFFSELVAVAMGGQNVRSLNGSTLESNFTDWAVGYALVAIEEMKQHGHNRYDIMNRLKPFITNTSVEIHPKGKASYTAPNVSNYIIFSNYLDGAPVDEGDRRYMFLSSRLTTLQAEKLTSEGYFNRLFAAIRSYPGAIRKWLTEWEPHPDFDPDGRAPNTDVKRTVIEMSKSDLELAAEDIIEAGAEGVTEDAISSSHMTRALVSYGAEAPTTTRLNTLLTRLGYRFACRKKWKNEACRIWVRVAANLSDEEAVERLNLSPVAEEFLR